MASILPLFSGSAALSTQASASREAQRLGGVKVAAEQWPPAEAGRQLGGVRGGQHVPRTREAAAGGVARRPLCLATNLPQRPQILKKPTPASLPRRISRHYFNPQTIVHAPQDLRCLAHSIAPHRSPQNRKYKGKRLTERTLKPNNMYQVEVASIANV